MTTVVGGRTGPPVWPRHRLGCSEPPAAQVSRLGALRRVPVDSPVMALPLQLTDFLPQRIPALRLVPAPPLDVDQEKLEEMIQDLAEPLAELEAFERDVTSSLGRVRAVAEVTTRSEEGRELFENGIRLVEERERALAREWATAQESRERQLMRARELSSLEPRWATYADLVDRFINLTIRLLEALRDFRLEIAVILTERDHKRDSPAFDDPEELKKYLKSV